ncbi:MAG: DUF6340 family protein [Spirochaetota bacterium]
MGRAPWGARIRATAGALLVLLAAAGCATRVPVTVTRPAEVNMAGARKIAVLDFPVTAERRLDKGFLLHLVLNSVFGTRLGAIDQERRISEYTTERFILALVRTGYFQVVGPDQLREAMGAVDLSGAGVVHIGSKADVRAVIHGEIYLLHTEDEEITATEEIVGPETDQTTEETSVRVVRTAALGLEYYVTRTDTGEVLAARSFEDTLREEQPLEQEFLLPDPLDMYREIVDSFMPRVARQLAPYTVRENRRLLRDRSGSPRMDQAKRLARGRIYDRALELYLQEWERTRNPAAGHNAAIMHEVTGDLDAAAALMKQVAERHPRRRILREYRRLQEARREQQRLVEQLG